MPQSGVGSMQGKNTGNKLGLSCAKLSTAGAGSMAELQLRIYWLRWGVLRGDEMQTKAELSQMGLWRELGVSQDWHSGLGQPSWA